MGPEPELRAELDLPPPDAVWPGAPTPFFVFGTLFAGRPIASVELLSGGEARPADFAGPAADGGTRFWAALPGTPMARGEVISLEARAHLEDGGTSTAELGRIEVEPAPEPAPAPGGGEGVIAICLATYEPDPELLRRQLDSLRAQTDSNWTCVISDDASSERGYEAIEAAVAGDSRFVISRSERRRGFYLNFERALLMAPGGAEFISLCDQDDLWYPEKLATLREAIGEAPLAYSDARLTDTEGSVLSETLWPDRRQNTADLTGVMVANSLAGASALIRADVAGRALPFPRVPGWSFHDQWLPAVARAAGSLARVDRALYDYVQHERAVLQGGFGVGPVPPVSRAELTSPRAARWRARYFYASIPLRIYARTLLDRGAAGGEAERRVLDRLASESPATALRLAVRSLRPKLGRDETSGQEWIAASGLFWRSARAGSGDTSLPPLNLWDLSPPRWG
jgi:glycosyltransferase involved in cell wall biosynthesis